MQFYKKDKHKKISFGFTLLELLIAIAIIGILASISFVALNGARKQGRDGRRKSDLETIRSALELYKADCNQYPGSLPAVGSALSATCGGVTNTYLQKRPGDPSSSTFGIYSYVPLPAGGPYRTYTLCTGLEDPPASPDITGCGACSPATCRHKVTNP